MVSAVDLGARGVVVGRWVVTGGLGRSSRGWGDGRLPEFRGEGGLRKPRGKRMDAQRARFGIRVLRKRNKK